jgi:hypothetical protein
LACATHRRCRIRWHATLLQDIYPTLAALAGLPPPPDVDGYDLSDLWKNPNSTIKPYSFSEYPRCAQPETPWADTSSCVHTQRTNFTIMVGLRNLSFAIPPLRMSTNIFRLQRRVHRRAIGGNAFPRCDPFRLLPTPFLGGVGRDILCGVTSGVQLSGCGGMVKILSETSRGHLQRSSSIRTKETTRATLTRTRTLTWPLRIVL